MRATVQLELEPFRVPNYVRVSVKGNTTCAGESTPPVIPLSELDSAALSALCEAFRIEVFRKANKELPPDAMVP